MEFRHILIMDDEMKIVNFISMALRAGGYKVSTAQNGKAGILSFCTSNPDLIIMDISLPDENGIDVIEEIRKVSDVPIIVISERNSESDVILSLDTGANDFMSKPFSMGELLARIRVLERYNGISKNESRGTTYNFGTISVDTEYRKVMCNNKEVHLTPMEYRLMLLLVSNEGKVITHRQISKEVWGYSDAGDAKSIRVCMASLRRKIECDPNDKYITTEVGVGYRFTPKKNR